MEVGGNKLDILKNLLGLSGNSLESLIKISIGPGGFRVNIIIYFLNNFQGTGSHEADTTLVETSELQTG